METIVSNKNLAILFFLILLSSCKSNKDLRNDEQVFIKEKLLLHPTKKEVLLDSIKGTRTIIYEELPLREVVFDNQTHKLFLRDSNIFYGREGCLSLLNVFNKKHLFISYSDDAKNQGIYGEEAFLREKIIIINISTEEFRILDNKEAIRLKGTKRLLHPNQYGMKVHAVDSINFNENFVNMYNAKNELVKFNLLDVDVFPLSCNGNDTD